MWLLRAAAKASRATRKLTSKQRSERLKSEKKLRLSRSDTKSILIRSPEHFRYYGGRSVRSDFAVFIYDINEAVRSGKSVCIDLSSAKHLYPCGVLIFMGQVDHWLENQKIGKISAKYPGSDLAEQMLQSVGVLEKLGLPPRKTITHNDVTRWRHFTGMNVDATSMESFMIELRELLGEQAQMGLADCINEAMSNVKHHAYGRDLGGKWWIFATLSEDKVFISIHDRGQSIPKTLLDKPKLMDYLRGAVWWSGRADGKLIDMAVNSNRSSTDLPWRGKGLPEMHELTKPSGELAIYSRGGFFRFSGAESVCTSGRLSHPITGTLIIWMVRIKGTHDEEDNQHF